MSCCDIFEVKKALKSCFILTNSWYEKSLLFSLLFSALFLVCILVPYGFIMLFVTLPYLLVIEKKLLLSNVNNKICWKDLILSPRRFGRSFCIMSIKLLGLVSIFPYLSLTFSSHLLAECKDLDFKGVILLSNELSKGLKFKIFCQGLFWLSLWLVTIMIAFCFLMLIKLVINISLQFSAIFILAAVLLSFSCLILPMWRKYIENLFIAAKKNKVLEKQG